MSILKPADGPSRSGRCSLRAGDRSGSRSRRASLAAAAVVERGIRLVEVSRYLRVSRAALTAQLRAHDT
jgi:hypothetical protein